MLRKLLYVSLGVVLIGGVAWAGTYAGYNGLLYVVGVSPGNSKVPAVTIVDSDGNPVSAGGGGTADSTAANQTLQIAQIGEVQASPTANTVLDRLKTLNASVLAGNVATGQAARSASVPVTIADINSGEYETVAASASAQSLGATGATGDYLLQVVCTPSTTSPGVVTVLDNATAIVSFPGGASSVSNLLPFTIPVNAYSTSGAWKVTTGTAVTCVGIGNFT